MWSAVMYYVEHVCYISIILRQH